jgi:hypothetical protein
VTENVQKGPTEAVLRIFVGFSRWNSVDVRSNAYQSLGQVFVRNPSLISKAGDVINKGFQSNEPKIKVQLVKCFSELLLEEDKRVKMVSDGKENSHG